MARSQPDLQNQYNTYKSNLQSLATKIGDLETDSDEHALVLTTLTALPPTRRAYRMIGGVLVESSVATVVPALETNRDGIRAVMETLVKQYKTLEDEFVKFQKDNKIKVVRQ